jgi:hypothetical protein
MVAVGLALMLAVALGMEKLPYVIALLASLGTWAVAVIAYAFMLSRKETQVAA